MKKKVLYLVFFAVLLAVAVVLTNCGGGGGNGNGDCADPTVDATGIWSVADTSTNNNCGEPLDSTPYTYDVTQSGSSITVISPVGTHSGQICGNEVTWSGSWPEDGGTTTATIVFTISGDSLSGTSTWSWTDGVDSCSGTNTFTGSR